MVTIDRQTVTELMEQQVLMHAQMRWVWLGLFQSIRPTVKYQPGKANIVTDALSRIQHGTSDARDCELPQTIKEGKDVVFALMEITIMMHPTKLKEWKQAYENDPNLKLAIQ